MSQEVLRRRIRTLDPFVTMFRNALLSCSGVPPYPPSVSKGDYSVDTIVSKHVSVV